MGRPTSLTPETQAVILASIEAGNYRQTAAQAAGIHRDTLNGWELRGAQGEEPYASFSDALKKAESKGEERLLARIVAGEEGWQRLAWVLERRFASRWAARVRTHVTEELDALTSRLRKSLDEDTFRKVVDAAGEDVGQASGASH